MEDIKPAVKILLIIGAGGIFTAFKFFQTGQMRAGSFALISGLVMITAALILIRQNRDGINRLMSEGWCVDADFDSAERPVYSAKPSHHMYNEWVYTITCSWTDPAGAYHVFTDRIRLHFDPSSELNSRRTVKVYVDKEDPDKYYMDLEFLKELDKTRR